MDRGLWLLLGVVLVVNFLSMPALRYDGDVMAWEMEAESLVYRGRLDVRPAIGEQLESGSAYLFFNADSGRWHSKYGIGNTLIYALPLAIERLLGGGETRDPGEVFGGPGADPFHITRRVELLNAFNLLLGLLLAGVLHRLASFYTRTSWSKILFVLACFYSSYLWNYLRAQSSQIYQCLFFSLAVLLLMGFAASVSKRGATEPASSRDFRQLAGSATAIACLCLVKLSYLPLLGIWGVAVLLVGWPGDSNPLLYAIDFLRRHTRLLLGAAAPPILGMLAILFWANTIKFGSPFSSGYEREVDLFAWDLGRSVPAYLFHPRFSVFIHFPLLLVALAGLPRVWRTHRFELAFAWSCFLTMFAINAGYSYWMGEAAVGPRYLLFALPVLAIPSIAVFEWIAQQPTQVLRAVCAAGISALLLASTWAQTRVNALEFHAFFRYRYLFQRSLHAEPEVFAYFSGRNTGLFNDDFLRYRAGGEPPPPLRIAEAQLTPERYAQLAERVDAHLASNYYFWPHDPGVERSVDPLQDAPGKRTPVPPRPQ